MRFVDLAVAGLVATSSMILLVAWNPQAADVSARRNLDEARLRDQLVAELSKSGLELMAQGSAQSICPYLHGLSNASVSFSGAVGGSTCGGSPPPGAAQARLEIDLGSQKVTVEDWFAEGP